MPSPPPPAVIRLLGSLCASHSLNTPHELQAGDVCIYLTRGLLQRCSFTLFGSQPQCHFLETPPQIKRASTSLSHFQWHSWSLADGTQPRLKSSGVRVSVSLSAYPTGHVLRGNGSMLGFLTAVSLWPSSRAGRKRETTGILLWVNPSKKPDSPWCCPRLRTWRWAGRNLKQCRVTYLALLNSSLLVRVFWAQGQNHNCQGQMIFI